MAIKDYQAISLFPRQISDCEYHLAVLDHVFKPNEEDHNDASVWVRDVDELVAYLKKSTDEVSKRFFKAVSNEAEVKKIENFIQAVRGSGRDVSQIMAAVGRVQTVVSTNNGAPTKIHFLGKAQGQMTFTKDKDHLVCPPAFLYDSSGAFRKQLESHLADDSWKEVHFAHPGVKSFCFTRADVKALIDEKIDISPCYLADLMEETDFWEWTSIIEKANPLELAILRGDSEEVKKHLSTSAYRGSKSSRASHLDLAVLAGHKDIVKALLQDSSKEEVKSAAVSAVYNGRTSILGCLLDTGIEPVIPPNLNHLGGMKMFLDKGAQLSANNLFDHRTSNSIEGIRADRLFKDSISSQATAELNETLNILFLSHAWQKKGQIELKRIGELQPVKIDLEGSCAEINCEIMSKTWGMFCAQHPVSVPKELKALVSDALQYAAEDNLLKAEGYFERYQNGFPVLFPLVISPYTDWCHYVGALIYKDYFCIFNGGSGSEGRALIHGKFDTDRMTEEFLKNLLSPRKTLDEFVAFTKNELPKLINLRRGKNAIDEAFVGYLFDFFNEFQQVGSCSFFNMQKLVGILLSCYLFDKADKTKNAAMEISSAVRTSHAFTREWDVFQQAWLLRNYLYSDTRQDFELCHGFVKDLLKSSWDLWLDEYSQATKNILYECEKRYLDLLSAEDRTIYKIDKGCYLVRAWQRHSLYPFRVSSTKKDRLR